MAQSVSPWLINKNVETLSQRAIPEDKIAYYYNGFDAYLMEIYYPSINKY